MGVRDSGRLLCIIAKAANPRGEVISSGPFCGFSWTHRQRGSRYMSNKAPAITGIAGALVLAGYLAAQPQNGEPPEPPELGFFITSVGIGDGGNLGGLEGADAHCQSLARAAGAGDRTWRAYLSTQGSNAVNARDRIGAGPWANAKASSLPRTWTTCTTTTRISI